MENITWVVLDGFSRYEISNTGMVRYRNNQKPCPHYDDGKNGYRKIKLYPDGSKKRQHFSMHRLVWLAFRGPIPEKMEIDHFDDNPSNNNLENLSMVTHKLNSKFKKQRYEKSMFSRKAPQKDDCESPPLIAEEAV